MSSGKIKSSLNTLCKIFALLFVLLVFSCATQRPVSAQRGYVSFQVFYDQLSPHGQWVDYPDYGYVWIPNVDRDFSPYSTAGHWVMSQYGWTWVSNYEWGWAPFHYGRWDYDNYYGWFWVPDNEWGPSWVTWRQGNGYYGWTPMRPGISVSLSFSSEYRDYDRWNFVRERDFGRSDLDRYYVDRRENDRIIRNSNVINNTYVDRSRNATYITGPPRSSVQKVTGRKISSVTVRDNDRPGAVLNDNQLKIYRPQVERISDKSQRPAPSRITNLQDIKPSRERNSDNQRNVVTPMENYRREELPTQSQQQMENRRQDQQKQIQQQQMENRRQDQQKQIQQQQIENRKQEQRQQEVKAKQRMDQQRKAQPQNKEQINKSVEKQRQKVANPSVDKRSEKQQRAIDRADKETKRQDKRRNK